MELDNLAAETAATMTTNHPDYAVLAARIAVSNLHKETKKVFSGQWCVCFLCVGGELNYVFGRDWFPRLDVFQFCHPHCL